MNATILSQWGSQKICEYARDVVSGLSCKMGLVLTSGGIHPPDHSLPRLKKLTGDLTHYL